MSSGFQQQESGRNLNFSESALTPQHGRKSDKETLQREEPRSYQPQPDRH
jgi:hypothetical protein